MLKFTFVYYIFCYERKFTYKYINWEKEYHRRILTQNEVYFASISKYNDPFEGFFQSFIQKMRLEIVSKKFY